jgi:hypothetical protein
MLSVRPCEACGTEFQPVKAIRRFCSRSCSNRGVPRFRYHDGLTGYQRNRDAILARRRREYAEHPEKQAARNLARKHTPVLVCEVPGCDQPGDRHHDDYGRPLDVRYLCRPHHTLWHKRRAA